jgi:biotin carboxyl carrier protein
MKLKAEIEGQEHQLNVTLDGTRVSAEIDGRRYDLIAHASQPGLYTLIAGGVVYQCRVAASGARPEMFDVEVGNQAYAISLSDPKRLRVAESAGAQTDGAAQIIAPMPGKIVRVLVEAGARVEAGDSIVVVEAMKMQNEMKSPRAGLVTELPVKAGATVNTGDVLAIIE